MIPGSATARSPCDSRRLSPSAGPSPPKRGSANIPAFVRPMARTGIERFARERGALEVDEESSTRSRLLRHVRPEMHTRRDDRVLPSRVRAGPSRPPGISRSRCNLACEHCYLDAGGTPLVATENFADRSELSAPTNVKVIDGIAAVAPKCVTILTGGRAAPAPRHPSRSSAAPPIVDCGSCCRHQRRTTTWRILARRLAGLEQRAAVAVARCAGSRSSRPLPEVRGAWQNTVAAPSTALSGRAHGERLPCRRWSLLRSRRDRETGGSPQIAPRQRPCHGRRGSRGAFDEARVPRSIDRLVAVRVDRPRDPRPAGEVAGPASRAAVSSPPGLPRRSMASVFRPSGERVDAVWTREGTSSESDGSQVTDAR